MKDRTVLADLSGNRGATFIFNRDRARGCADNRVVAIEARSVLADHVERLAGCAPCRSVNGVRVAHGNDVRISLMNRRVKHEARAVDCILSFDDVAGMVRQDQVRHLHLREVDAHRIRPVELGTLGIADRKVPGEAVVEAVHGERADRCDQMLLTVFAFGLEILEGRNLGEDQAFLFRLIDGYAGIRFSDFVEHVASLGLGVETKVSWASASDGTAVRMPAV